MLSWFWPTSDQINQAAEWKLLKRVNNLKWEAGGHPAQESNPLVDVKSNQEVIPEDCQTSQITKTAQVVQVPIGERGYMNTFIMKSPTQSPKKVLVMSHGFGVGLGLYYKNYQALAELEGWDVYSIDWLGMGRSSRPHFNLRKSKKQTEEDHIKEAEDFFVDSLENWRKELNIEKFHLLGHSLGGYLSTVYTLKYPEHVEKLILASPVGIPESPYLAKETPESRLIAAEQANEAPREFELNPRPNIPFWVPYAWNNLHVTPQWIVRMVGPYGPKLVGGYVSRRFSHLDASEQTDVKEYLYHVASMKGSGEYALSTILSFGAFARHPLIKRLPKVQVPITFVYGEIDWMDFKHAERLKDKLKYPSKVVVLPEVGHQLFIEKSEQFNKFLRDELLDKS